MTWLPPGCSCTALPAGRSSFGMARIFITPPSIFMVWISTTPATGVLADNSAAASLLVICMKAPVAFCAGVVPRTQESVTVTSAKAETENAARASVVIIDFMNCLLE